MRTCVSTHLFRRRRLEPRHLDSLLAAGATGIELFCSRLSYDYRDRRQVETIAGWLRDHPGALHSMHSPIYGDEHDGRSGEPPLNIADTEPRHRIDALDEVQRALEIADHVPVRFLVQHIGPSRLAWNQRAADCALSSLERLRLLCKQAGIQLLVENIPNGLSTPETLLTFLDSNHLDDVGVCFDSGHAHMPEDMDGGGGAVAAWERLAPRVRSTHLHDNNGSHDDHLWPGSGTLPWAELMPHLLAAGPDLPWLLEVGDHADTGDPCDGVRAAFARLRAWADGKAKG